MFFKVSCAMRIAITKRQWKDNLAWDHLISCNITYLASSGLFSILTLYLNFNEQLQDVTILCTNNYIKLYFNNVIKAETVPIVAHYD